MYLKLKKYMVKILSKIKSFWDFIWHGKGALSWASFIIFSFIILSIAYPLFIGFLGFFGVSDIVAVVSGSMIHNKETEVTSYFTWLENNGFNINDTKNWNFPNGLNLGDVVIVMKAKPSEIKIGNVIVFKKYDNTPIIHRVVEIKEVNDKYYFTTKGDANPAILEFEKSTSEENVAGKGVISIPFLGIPKLIFTWIMGVFV